MAREAGCQTPAVNDSRVSRRAFLLAATTVGASGLGVGLAACEAGQPPAGSPTEAPVEELTPILIGQQALLARYAQTVAAFPELATQLTDLAAQTTAHTEALVSAVPAAAAQASAATAASDSDSGSEPSSTKSRPSPVPADAATALAELGRAVDAALGALRNSALRAEGDLAALLGSCAASTACHVWLLG